MRELSDLFADDHGESIEICYLLANVREGLDMEPAVGFQEGAKYSCEQQRELIQYNNQHPKKNRKWRELSLEVFGGEF